VKTKSEFQIKLDVGNIWWNSTICC